MMVLVTHHVEEVPEGFTHAMLMRKGAVLAAGPLAEVFTERNLSRCFGVPLQVERRAALVGTGVPLPDRTAAASAGDRCPRCAWYGLA